MLLLAQEGMATVQKYRSEWDAKTIYAFRRVKIDQYRHSNIDDWIVPAADSELTCGPV